LKIEAALIHLVMKINVVSRLLEKKDPVSLDVFRILFGLILFLQYFSFYSSDFIDKGILAPKLNFYYDLTPFIVPLSAGLMKFMMLVTLIAPIFIIIGRFFRVAVLSYMICFGYFFLVEEAYYNNHFYVILLLCFLFLFYKPSPASDKKPVPFWLIFLFQFQIAVVYFYGGIVKINSDWLFLQQPVRTLVELNGPLSPFPSLVQSEAIIYYLTYGGLIFDLLISFLLWNKRTFKFAVIFSVIFHLTNLWMFNYGFGGEIGIFPFMMIAANVLFMDTDKLRSLYEKYFPSSKKEIKSSGKKAIPVVAQGWNFQKPALYFVYTYIFIQLVLPFRYCLSPAHVDWTGQCQSFAWRMKIYTKKVDVKFTVRRFPDDQPVTIQTQKFLNSMQVNMMGQHADMVYKFVRFVVTDLDKRLNIKNPIINAEIMVSFNGRPPVHFIDPKVNLATVTYDPYALNSWVMPAPK
jgi:hypothetical protein